jgi:hypothetical protein
MGLGFESAWPTHGTVCIVCPRCPSFDRDTADGETGGGDV